MVTPKTKSLGFSADKLIKLGFDPLEAMVRQYNHLTQEIQTQEEIAAGRTVRLRADGKAKAYSPEYHMNIIVQAATLAEKLMRYGYARVPEDKEQAVAVNPVLNINLSDGTSITFNKEADDEE